MTWHEMTWTDWMAILVLGLILLGLAVVLFARSLRKAHREFDRAVAEIDLFRELEGRGGEDD